MDALIQKGRCSEFVEHSELLYQLEIRKAITEYQLDFNLAYMSIFQRRVTPFLANLFVLKSLIKQHYTWFSDTIYQNSPELIYQFGEIATEATPLPNGILYILVLPHILLNDMPVFCTFPYFRKVNGEWWSGQDVGRSLIKIREKFIPLDILGCKGSEAQGYLCHLDVLTNKNYSTCWFDDTFCKISVGTYLTEHVVELLHGYHVPNELNCKGENFTQIDNYSVYFALSSNASLKCDNRTLIWTKETITYTLAVTFSVKKLNWTYEKSLLGEDVVDASYFFGELRKLQKQFEERQQFLANALSKPVEAGKIGFDIFADWVLDLFDKRWVKLFNAISWILFYLFMIIWVIELIMKFLLFKLNIILHGLGGRVAQTAVNVTQNMFARNPYHELNEMPVSSL